MKFTRTLASTALIAFAALAANASEAHAQRFIDWNANAVRFRGQIGRPISVTCPPGMPTTRVWGTGVYSDDSSICSAAVHAGRLNPQMGGQITFFIQPGQMGYQGSFSNGLASQNYGQWAGSFSFTPGAPQPVMVAPPPPPPPVAVAVPVQPQPYPGQPVQPGFVQPAYPPGGAPMPPGGFRGATPIDWTANATAYRGQNGNRLRFFCPAGGSFGNLWGSGPYTDDSSICTAAVHAGRLNPAQGGMVRVRILPGMMSYPPRMGRMGIMSRAYGQYSGSYMIE